jgi:hypothetical protein
MAETYIARSTAIAARLIGGEMMIMSAVDSTFFTLNEVATVIWQSADGQTPLGEIVSRRICAEFDITPQQAEADAGQFVAELSQHGVLLVSDRPIANAASVPQPPASTL